MKMKAEIVRDFYLFDPTTARESLELMDELRDEINNLIEYVSLKREVKAKLSVLAQKIDNFVAVANYCAEFDAGVHRSMLRLSGIERDLLGEHREYLSSAERLTVLKHYQEAAESYITSKLRKAPKGSG